MLTAGTVLPPLRVEPVSRSTLALFAGASGDHNPVHIDLDFAQAHGYDDVFAHGMLSMAWLGRLLTQWVEQARIRSFQVRFSAMTPVHGRPVCTGVVTTVADGLATLDLTVRLDDGTTTLLGTATVVAAPTPGGTT
ncbi:hypothetical protein BH11ACT8_BH11ACT8_01100 [soil metagenome]